MATSVFQNYDTNHSNTIDESEFREILVFLGDPHLDEDGDAVFETVFDVAFKQIFFSSLNIICVHSMGIRLIQTSLG